MSRRRDGTRMIDAHNHLDFAEFDADRAEVVAEARAGGVVGSIVAGTAPATWPRTMAVAAATNCLAMVGVHPGWVHHVADWEAIGEALAAHPARGIGEIGLDRRTAADDATWAWQIAGLRAQLAVARATDRPVAFHCVGAYPELLATIRRDGLPKTGGYVHGWSGPPDRVDEAVTLGLHLSFGPPVTGAHAPRQWASARAVPLDRLLVETDAPDQAPRGEGRRRGRPADVRVVAEAVAKARGDAFDDVASATHDNVLRLFQLDRWPG